MKKKIFLVLLAVLFVLWIVDVRLDCAPPAKFILKWNNGYSVNCPIMPGVTADTYQLPWYEAVFNII